MAKSSKALTLGQNIEYAMEGNTLVMRVDLSTEIGPSASGKTVLIASTQGNKEIANGIRVGINIYRYAEEKAKKAKK